MAKNKTNATTKPVTAFIDEIDDEVKRDDCFTLIKLHQKITGFEPVMWGPSIIGFGKYHYRYESGHQGDMPIAAFSPRKTAIVFYFYPAFDEKEDLLKKLGKHKTGKGCVYVKKLSDVDLKVIEKLTIASIEAVKRAYG